MKLKIAFLMIALILFSGLSYGAAPEHVNLAVVNFYCDSSAMEKDWLGVGFAETLSEKLTRLSNVNVIEREKQRPVLNEIGVDINQKFDSKMGQTLGQTLGADYLISGDLEEKNNELNVKFQLFDVKDGAIVAEERLSGPTDSVFDLQAELALKVSKYFNTPVSDEVKEELYFMPTQSMASFEKFSSGLQLYETNRIDEAYNFFLGSVKEDTVFLDAHRYFEYTSRKLGKLDDFIANYEAMLVKEPENPVLMNYLGNGYFDKGDLVKAEELYKKSIKIAPTFGNPHNNLATVYAFTGNFKEALSEYEKGLKYSERKAPVYYNMGLCYMNMGDKETAKTYFAKALEIDSKNPDFVAARYYLHGFKVIVNYREKNVPGSTFGEILLNCEPVFEIQTEAGGFSPVERARIVAGRLQTMINDGLEPYELKIGKINEQIVIKTASEQLIMTFTKDMAVREDSTPEKLAEHKMNILKDIMSSSTTVSYTSGGYVLQGVSDKSKVKDMEGTSEEATCLHRGDAYYSEGKVDLALGEYNKALEINPSFAPAHFCIGVIAYDKKDYEEATVSFNEAIKNSPEYMDAYIWLGKTFMEEGKKEEAKEVFVKAMELDIENSKLERYMDEVSQ